MLLIVRPPERQVEGSLLYTFVNAHIFTANLLLYSRLKRIKLTTLISNGVPRSSSRRDIEKTCSLGLGLVGNVRAVRATAWQCGVDAASSGLRRTGIGRLPTGSSVLNKPPIPFDAPTAELRLSFWQNNAQIQITAESALRRASIFSKNPIEGRDSLYVELSPYLPSCSCGFVWETINAN